MADGGVCDLVEIGGHGEIADHDFLGVALDVATGGVAHGIGSGGAEFIVSDAEGEHALGIGLDLDLLDAAAHGEDFGDAGDGLEASGDGPVGEGAEVLWGDVSGGIEDADEHDVSHEGSGWRHVGGDVLREFGGGESFLDELAGLVDVGAPIELDVGEGEADVVDGAESVEAIDAHEGSF